MRKKVLALILAGGAGGRLEVLTEKRSKPATPFAGTYRLIDFSLSNCVHSGISDVWIVEQYEPHSLNDHLANGRPWDLDRTYGGLQVLPPYTGGEAGGFAQGNADALYRQKRFIREFDPDLLLVLSADHIYKLDYRDVIDAHLARRAEVTMVTTEVPLAEAGRFGTVKVEDGGRVSEFAYKPERPESETVTAEVFVYDARVLLETLERLAGEKQRGGHDEGALKDYGHELLPALVAAGGAFAFPLAGYWRDLGTIESYWQGHMDLLLAPGPRLNLDDPAWPVLTYGTQRMPARVEGPARVDQSLISPGCVVRGEVVRSILAPGVIVEEGAAVRDAVVLRDAVVRVGARVDHAIIDERVKIGAGAVVGESREKTKGQKPGPATATDIAVIGMGAEVADGVRLPAGARVKPENGAGAINSGASPGSDHQETEPSERHSDQRERDASDVRIETAEEEKAPERQGQNDDAA